MSFTPRSQAPSRSGTPAPGRSPSRLVVPHTLRPTHSLSNLHVHSHNVPSAINSTLPTHSANIATQASPPTNQELDSSASSVVNVEGILVQEPDADLDTVDDEDGNAVGYIADPGSKQNLRDQLRRTLSKRPSNAGQLRLSTVGNQFVHLPHLLYTKISHQSVLHRREGMLMSMRFLMNQVNDVGFSGTFLLTPHMLLHRS